LWRLAYRFAGKQKTLALDVYPAVSLDEARTRRDEAKKFLARSSIHRYNARSTDRQERTVAFELSLKR
jgi:hypothetical protein